MPVASNTHDLNSLHTQDLNSVCQSLDLCLSRSEKHLPNLILSFIDPEPEHYLDFCQKCSCLDSVDPWVRICHLCHFKPLLVAEFNNRVYMYQYLNGRFKGVSQNKFKRNLHTYFNRLTTPTSLALENPPDLFFSFL